MSLVREGFPEGEQSELRTQREECRQLGFGQSGGGVTEGTACAET